MSVRDELTNARLQDVARGSFRCIDTLCEERIGTQLGSAAVLFLLICKLHQQEPREVLQLAANILNQALRERNIHALAVKHYLKHDASADSAFTYF